MLVAHKIALDPTNTQRSYFARGCGAARFAYNWALAEWQRQYQAGEKPSEVSLRRQLNALKREQYPWMFDVTKCAVQEAIIDLGGAFRSFFEKRGKYPRFKKKGVYDSFCAANETGTLRTNGKRIKLPVIGWVRMREVVRFEGVLKRGTIGREADRWFVSLTIEAPEVAVPLPLQEVVGVDLGVNTLATPSRGEVVTGPKAHTALLKRLRPTSRRLSNKQRGSNNRAKAKNRLARLHGRIVNIRKDATHKATTKLAKTFRRIGIEDLNVRGMVRNRRLARSILDGGFFEFRRQLQYEAKRCGAVIIVADRWFASSKRCSCCGLFEAELDLSQRRFRCSACGFEADRDWNAAKNLENLAASSAVSACGEERSGAVRKSRVKRASKKQDPNSKDQLCVA
jgi:putative transposase